MTDRELFEMFQDAVHVTSDPKFGETYLVGSWQGGNSLQSRVWAEFNRRVKAHLAKESAPKTPDSQFWYRDLPHETKS